MSKMTPLEISLLDAAVEGGRIRHPPMTRVRAAPC